MTILDVGDKCTATRDRLLLISVLLVQFGYGDVKWLSSNLQAELILLITEQIEKCAETLNFAKT